VASNSNHVTTRKTRLLRKLLAYSLLVACAAPAAADPHLTRDFAEDAKLYFTAPLRWDGDDWLHVGETVALVGLAHQFDGDVRDHFVAGKIAPLRGDDPHSARDAAPAAAIVVATWAGAFLAQNSDGYAEGRDMLEATVFSSITTTLLKYAAQRSRPNETADPNAWRERGDSFPSLHTSAAFAIGTVLAESGSDNHRWLRRFLGYGIAGATAYARLHDNVHWLSDTVAGAAVGVASARFVTHREDARSRTASVSLLPVDGGLVLSYNAIF
jgi:membrane-associated phospholipid phosphatase